MRKSFYTWLMTHRHSNADTALARLADLVFEDVAFPRQSHDFETISRYLEDNVYGSFNLSDFDAIWDMYEWH
ncbi:YozE family protein [Streptococcus sp. zg-JUN1979]|uniref:YozE family protein n=1 Tax=Streptococcus sp. zg-JUN1979 TaxID=3391450 RepID=UPI0039A5BA6D